VNAPHALDPHAADSARIVIILIVAAIVVFRRQLLPALARVLILAFIGVAAAGVVYLVQLMRG
jgi:hypothetical protein